MHTTICIVLKTCPRPAHDTCVPSTTGPGPVLTFGVVCMQQLFPGLQILHLGFNNLLNVVETTAALKPLTQLSVLTLVGNPMCLRKDYRTRLVNWLRGVTRLDGVEVEEWERNTKLSDHTLILGAKVRFTRQSRTLLGGHSRPASVQAQPPSLTRNDSIGSSPRFAHSLVVSLVVYPDPDAVDRRAGGAAAVGLRAGGGAQRPGPLHLHRGVSRAEAAEALQVRACGRKRFLGVGC